MSAIRVSVAVCLLGVLAGAGDALARTTAPAATTRASEPSFTVTGAAGNDVVSFTIDVSAAPELRGWATKAANNAIKWYPQIAELLASDGFSPPRTLHLAFKLMDGIAYTSGDTITIAPKWVHDHPDDFGMVVHEMTHAIQRYRSRKNPGWLVEGIADYVRYYVADVGSPRRHFDAELQSYASGYQPAAGLLDWL